MSRTHIPCNNVIAGVDLGDDVDISIDMDILRHGDFVINNHRGTTTFSFRSLSIGKTDLKDMIVSV